LQLVQEALSANGEFMLRKLESSDRLGGPKATSSDLVKLIKKRRLEDKATEEEATVSDYEHSHAIATLYHFLVILKFDLCPNIDASASSLSSMFMGKSSRNKEIATGVATGMEGLVR
jgi:hypothetical protein